MGMVRREVSREKATKQYPHTTTQFYILRMIIRNNRLFLLGQLGQGQTIRASKHSLKQTRSQSLFMFFGGERRLWVRLRRAGSHGKVRRKNSESIFFLRTFP